MMMILILIAILINMIAILINMFDNDEGINDNNDDHENKLKINDGDDDSDIIMTIMTRDDDGDTYSYNDDEVDGNKILIITMLVVVTIA